MAQVPKVRLSEGLEICRILNGMWQVSGAHGPIDTPKAVNAMDAYINAGLTTFDMADIYGPAEEIFGAFSSQLKTRKGEEALKGIQGLTKWVPHPGPMSRNVVEKAIQQSLKRMRVKSLDCLQFHWWDYSDKRYLEALGHLSDLQQEGVIRELALTNFDTKRLEEITGKGIRISSNQVQYSLIDRRPMVKMAQFCDSQGIQLLAYGTLGGGLISEKYLGAAEPRGQGELKTASLSKYKNMINMWGGWGLFQELLGSLDSVARSQHCTIVNVAIKYILDMPAVGGVIVGSRLGVPGAEHIQENLKGFEVNLSANDISKIESVLSRSKDLIAVIGDCGDEYRN
ncbi:putative oxidoreductase YccK-like [Huso huso]|uniref:Oxidoreductase YccK-like n=1 Tax=Huso huso TaxID=61971 RepID=A0ABR0Z7U8_HUSHU